jgi:hypothetical protein
MRLKYDMSDQVFNNLKVIRFSSVKNTNAHWICQCLLCGKETEVSRPNLLSGNTKDCGCRRSQKISESSFKHGLSSSPTWVSWSKMRQRIITKKNKTYASIDYDKRWDDFECFLKDMGERPQGHSIDRIDNTKGYYKENCRWATQAQQNRNRSNNVILTFEGKTMCMIDWAKHTGLNRNTISKRLKRGLSIEEVLKK